MRNLIIVALLIIAAAGGGFLIGKRNGHMDGREEVIQMLIPAPSKDGSWISTKPIEVETIIRKASKFSEVTVLGLKQRTTSGKAAVYRGAPLLLVVRPVENHDKTITITAKWTENSNIPNPETIVVPPVTIVDGGTATHQIGALRFSFSAKVQPR